MCISPLHIVNPSKWIDPSSCQRLILDVPCGHCSECLVSYRNDWRNRAYFECLSTFRDGNYVLFDTLSYSDENLPRLSNFFDIPENLDFSCFSRSDLQSFLDRLRHRFTPESLRFFVSSEYGSDKVYYYHGHKRKATIRPHYHLLLFVDSSIAVKDISLAISECWYYGRTDGYPYKPLSYVNNNVFKDYFQGSRAVVTYVLKYCTKNFEYDDIVSRRLRSLFAYDFSLYSDVKNFVRPFHLQSKGFGYDAAINIIGRDKLLSDGGFKIVGSNGLIRFVSLSSSFQRKLLYNYSRIGGKVFWYLNSDGFDYKHRFKHRAVNYLVNRICGLTPAMISVIRDQVISKLFCSDRFNSGTPDYVIDHSFNIYGDGLRNYSSHDKSWIGKPVFSLSDFGSQCDGYKHTSIRFVDTPSFPGDVVHLSVLKRKVLHPDCSYVDNYLSTKSIKDDGLPVIKLLSHLNNVFKNV